MQSLCRLLVGVGMGVGIGLAAAPSAQAAPSTDDRGFVDSAARCADGQEAAAIGRTQRSQVVVCPGADGAYKYIGVRISDGAKIQASARATDDGFVAQADGASYNISPSRLEVFSDGRLIYGDTWIDYRRPGD